MNLTSLANLKAYLGLQDDNAIRDAQYVKSIARASEYVTRWTDRTFARTAYTDLRLTGSGSDRLAFPDYPAISVSSLKIGATVISVSPDAMASGYQFDEYFLYLFGHTFIDNPKRNIVVSYVAGYTTSQTSFIPANPGPYVITPSNLGYAATDLGVVNVGTGLPLTLVGSGPATGQYAFSEGVYTFAAADAGVQVTMSYDYVPGPVEQATIEMVALTQVRRSTLGIQSKTIGNESITFADASMSQAVQGMLSDYKRRIPT